MDSCASFPEFPDTEVNKLISQIERSPVVRRQVDRNCLRKRRNFKKDMSKAFICLMQWNEVRCSNESTVPIGTSVMPPHEEFDTEEQPEGEDEEAEQIEDGGSEGGEFGEDEL